MKVAVSLPDDLFDAAELYARERGMARSQLVAEALEAYLTEHGSEAITQCLDRVYRSEPAGIEGPLMRAQLASLEDEAW